MFGRFTNFVYNDIMLLLEEALKNLRTIRSEQLAMADTETWRALPPQTQHDRQVEFGRTEQNTAGLMQLANSIVHMLFYVTGMVASSFIIIAVEHLHSNVSFYRIINSTICNSRVRESNIRNSRLFHH
jgi:hypothetical protein